MKKLKAWFNELLMVAVGLIVLAFAARVYLEGWDWMFKTNGWIFQ